MSVRKVVIEDGDTFMRLCTMELLIKNGFDVAETANGIEASWESQPEIMLTDITVPDMDSRKDLEHKRWGMFRTIGRTLGQLNTARPNFEAD